MKDWFPLTSYDFYAHLASGMIALAAYDRVFMASALANEQHWTVVAGVFWAAVAYLLGQILAMPSAALLEHGIARRFLRPPTDILLGIHMPRLRERVIMACTGAREYAPLPAPNRNSVRKKLARILAVGEDDLAAEAAFVCAFPYARSVSDSATRLDNFLNQYGMSRNTSFSAAVAVVILSLGEPSDPSRTKLLIGAGVLMVGLFFRFIKFYAAYAREVFRTFDKAVPAV